MRTWLVTSIKCIFLRFLNDALLRGNFLEICRHESLLLSKNCTSINLAMMSTHDHLVLGHHLIVLCTSVIRSGPSCRVRSSAYSVLFEIFHRLLSVSPFTCCYASLTTSWVTLILRAASLLIIEFVDILDEKILIRSYESVLNWNLRLIITLIVNLMLKNILLHLVIFQHSCRNWCMLVHYWYPP